MGGCLAASNNAAKSLAAALGKPIVGVHHMVRVIRFLHDVDFNIFLSKHTHLPHS
jgi:tRNA A37 threonylcarbamoyltransferase TsaD